MPVIEVTQATAWFAGITLFFTWTTTVIGCIMWLNGRFNLIVDELNKRVSTTTYDTRHEAIERRLLQLELWIARMEGRVNHERDEHHDKAL